MQDLPVHHSQKLVAKGPDYCDFEVYLRPTSDFKAFIASKGDVTFAADFGSDILVLTKRF